MPWTQSFGGGSRVAQPFLDRSGVCCEVADEQIRKIVEAIQLGPRWEEEVLSIIAVEDEVEKVRDGRQKVQERLRRLGRAYVDGVYDDDEYKRQKRDPGARA